MKIKIKSEDNPEWYGDTVTFNDGELHINGFDGMTKISKDEAKQLLEELIKYVDDKENKTPQG